MKTIPLTQGQCTMVDDADYESLIQWRWHAMRMKSGFYAARAIYEGKKQTRILMHREICIVESGMLVDHRDRNTLNNQRSNLRSATHSQNCQNKRREVNNRSGFKGVHWAKSMGKWAASVGNHHESLVREYFENPEEAARWYDKNAVALFGEFATTNEMLGLIHSKI